MSVELWTFLLVGTTFGGPKGVRQRLEAAPGV